MTFALLAIQVSVLLGLWIEGYSPFELQLGLDHDLLKPWGANHGPLTANGEGWRLLTAVFIPANVAQLLVNSWALWGLGRFLEPLAGGFALGFVFVLCGFAGNVSALVWDPGAITAGAAPAILGLVAAGAALLLRRRGAESRSIVSKSTVSESTAPQGAVKQHRLSLLAFLAFNVGGELLQNRFVFAAYLGGATTGFLAGLVLGWHWAGDEDQVRTARAGVLAFAAIVLALVTPLLMPQVDNIDTLYSELVEVENKAVEIYEKARRSREQGRLEDVEVANIIEDGILSYWREMSEKFEALRHVPPRDVDRFAAIEEYLRRREEAWHTLADGLRRGDQELIDTAAQKAAEADEAATTIDTAAGPENKK